MQRRKVFFVSDRTGITAETLGNSLLSQFEGIDFDTESVPFVDTAENARRVVEAIDRNSVGEIRPIVFLTVVQPEIRSIIRDCGAVVLDFFTSFIVPLEKELGVDFSYIVGRTHTIDSKGIYERRIEAVNYALVHDDGGVTNGYEQAQLVLVGASRCGKTPTSLYLALQFGIKVANYPFTEGDMAHLTLPKVLKDNKRKLYGLTIDPERLHEIRTERMANSRYASRKQCALEVREIEALYRAQRIPCINTTKRSVEEIAAKILADTGIERHLQ